MVAIEVYILSVLLAVLLIYYLVCTDKKNNWERKPPGPSGFPIVGSLLFIRNHGYEVLTKMARVYGDIFCIRLGSIDAVILNDYESIREALVKKSAVFIGRPQVFLTVNFFKGKDLIFNGSPTWAPLRNFAYKSLKQFGFGKTSLEVGIVDEVKSVIQVLEKYDGSKVDISDKFFAAVFNVAWQMIAGRKFQVGDPTLKRLHYDVRTLFKLINPKCPLNFFPWLRFVVPGGFSYWESIKCHDSMRKLVEEEVRQHQKTFREDEPRDFIDCFISEVHNKGGFKEAMPPFDMEHLLGTIRDLLFGSMVTTDATIQWSILYLAKYPEFQERVQKELDEGFGMHRIPSYTDRKTVPFTMATILEVHRMASVVPLSIPRAALENVDLCGYNIPKGTTVIQNLWAVHYDPRLWDSPEIFNPQRFLDETGNINPKVAEHVIPFSIGPRACIGEPLAKLQFFIYFTMLFQHFTFSFVPNVPPPSFEPVETITLYPQPYEVVITKRHP